MDTTLQGWLLQVFHKYMSVNYKRFMSLGVHPGQLPFLKTIGEQEGISQRELAQRIHVKPPTVAVAMKRMEKAGLICRRPAPGDQRVSQLFLTVRGQEMAESIRVALEETELALAAGFSEEEIRTMKGFCRRMAENLARMEER